MNVAIIPARGGSKRIPRKNIKIFCSKPMIAWSILAAIESNCFDRVIVSTDDKEIADIAVSYGAEVPFFRPESLADDFTGTIPVVAHAVDWLIRNGCDVENVCCIYATAPFLVKDYLEQALTLLVDYEVDYCFSVGKFSSPVQRALMLDMQGKCVMVHPENFNLRSQDVPDAYHDAGQFYWGTKDAWLSGKEVFNSNSLPFILPPERVQDIDTLDEWLYAELMMKCLL